MSSTVGLEVEGSRKVSELRWTLSEKKLGERTLLRNRTHEFHEKANGWRHVALDRPIDSQIKATGSVIFQVPVAGAKTSKRRLPGGLGRWDLFAIAPHTLFSPSCCAATLDIVDRHGGAWVVGWAQNKSLSALDALAGIMKSC